MKGKLFGLLFILGHIGFAQDWNSYPFKRGEQFEAVLITLHNDTLKGFVKFEDPVAMQEEVHFYAKQNVKKSLTVYKPADLVSYEVGDKLYHCIPYSGGVGSKTIRGNLLVKEDCITEYVWYYKAEHASTIYQEKDESLQEFYDRKFLNYEVFYNTSQSQAVDLDYFLMSYERRMADFVKEDEALSSNVLNKKRGYGKMHVLSIIQKYNSNCKD
jgi:hypothetical protein